MQLCDWLTDLLPSSACCLCVGLPSGSLLGWQEEALRPSPSPSSTSSSWRRLVSCSWRRRGQIEKVMRASTGHVTCQRSRKRTYHEVFVEALHVVANALRWDYMAVTQ